MPDKAKMSDFLYIFLNIYSYKFRFSLSLSNYKYFNIAYCFLWVNICHTIEEPFIPKYKAIAVIYYAAERQLV